MNMFFRPGEKNRTGEKNKWPPAGRELIFRAGKLINISATVFFARSGADFDQNHKGPPLWFRAAGEKNRTGEKNKWPPAGPELIY